MKRSYALFLATIALLWIGGCGGGRRMVTSEQTVRFVTQRDLVARCTFLGRVTGSSSLGGIAAQNWGKARSESEMENNAARLGANVVLVHNSQGGFMGAESSGDAYLCGSGTLDPGAGQIPVTVVPSGVQSGCVKDTDCKGDRVCESGRCVKP